MSVRDFNSFKNGQPHIIGQPFTLHAISVPCNAKIHCNCGGTEVEVSIVNSTAAACPSCRKSYNALFNPTTNSVEFQIATPAQEIQQ